MTTYLLLRDNKQSGPYSFDELKEKGLKAYDLVWIEGKSAAWRYPSEIEELIAFAPIVEEQPFDRFYKKPSQISNVRPSGNEPSARPGIISAAPAGERASSNPMVAASVMSGDTSAVPGKRIIYVTLPAGKSIPAARTPVQEQPPARKEVAQPPLHEKYLPDHSAAPQPALSQDMPEENPSHYLEDWKAGVEITPRAYRPRRSSRLGQSVVMVLTVVALLAAGIFIGLSINKSSLGFIKNASLHDGKDKPASVNTSPVDHSSQPLAINSLPPSIPARDVVPAKDSIVAAAPAGAAITKVPAPKVSSPVRGKAVPAIQKSQAAVTTARDSSLLATPAVHRESSHRADISVEKVDKDVIRNNLSNLVSLGASGYTVGTFGGISGLQLTVSNRSVYALDLVVVEVQYIQANKKVFKTENLYFRGIAPGSALMQEAPKSSRGIKIQYKITLVNSKELGLSYSAL
ncbi:hypothetical protein Q4E93_28075 [Flavitalea sp. BT771]|uniref:DUF4339 domain-containing protein n=1 Tax=Flavitalea sp. BT771 TaxID=3063329 RepID=UPI0026E46F9A|nr:hypothetical protein [Flavitalea sp. BT771]MDO6434502.1 hypothetical protein [Flavitalea sp. BT771]MDV6223402.1 hypothetical protein [Flavitalea sp. BT771]